MGNEIIMEIKMITPELAKEYLDSNYDNNRNAKSNNIDRMASDMRKGKWALTHQGIALDPDEFMFDGANRMRAVIKAGVSVPMCVYKYMDWNVANAALYALDIGVKRTFRDVMKISGENIGDFAFNHTMIGACRFLASLDAGSCGYTQRISDEKIREYMRSNSTDLERLYGLVNRVGSGHSIKKPNASMVVALYKAMKYGVDDSTIHDFVESYTKNIVYFPDREYNVKAALDCRDYTERAKSRFTTNEDVIRYENYLYSFSNNQKKVGKKERYPLNTLLNKEEN